MAQPLHVAGITCMALAMLMSFLVTISSPPAMGLAMVKSSLKDSQGDLEGFYVCELYSVAFVQFRLTSILSFQ
jgi:hypothetical protein